MNKLQRLNAVIRGAAADGSNPLVGGIFAQVRQGVERMRAGGVEGDVQARNRVFVDEDLARQYAEIRDGDAAYDRVADTFLDAMRAYERDPNALTVAGRPMLPAEFVNETLRRRVSSHRSEQEQKAAEFSTPGLAIKAAGELATEAIARPAFDVTNLVTGDWDEPSATFATNPLDDPLRAAVQRKNPGAFVRNVMGSDAFLEGYQQPTFTAQVDPDTGEEVAGDPIAALGRVIGSGGNLLYKATLVNAALGASGAAGAMEKALSGMASKGAIGGAVAGGVQQLPTMVALGAMGRAQEKPTLGSALSPSRIILDDAVNAFIAGGIERLAMSRAAARANKIGADRFKAAGLDGNDVADAVAAFGDDATAGLVKNWTPRLLEQTKGAVRQAAATYAREIPEVFARSNRASVLGEFTAGYLADIARGSSHEDALANGLFFGLLDVSAATGRQADAVRRAGLGQARVENATLRDMATDLPLDGGGVGARPGTPLERGVVEDHVPFETLEETLLAMRERRDADKLGELRGADVVDFAPPAAGKATERKGKGKGAAKKTKPVDLRPLARALDKMQPAEKVEAMRGLSNEDTMLLLDAVELSNAPERMEQLVAAVQAARALDEDNRIMAEQAAASEALMGRLRELGLTPEEYAAIREEYRPALDAINKANELLELKGREPRPVPSEEEFIARKAAPKRAAKIAKKLERARLNEERALRDKEPLPDDDMRQGAMFAAHQRVAQKAEEEFNARLDGLRAARQRAVESPERGGVDLEGIAPVYSSEGIATPRVEPATQPSPAPETTPAREVVPPTEAAKEDAPEPQAAARPAADQGKGAGVRSRRSAQPAARVATLPEELRGARPRYGYRGALYVPTFNNDVDFALYIVAQRGQLSKADSRYVDWLRSIGYSDEAMLREGARVRGAIKALAKEHFDAGLKEGKLPIPRTAQAPDAPADAPTTAQFTPNLLLQRLMYETRSARDAQKPDMGLPDRKTRITVDRFIAALDRFTGATTLHRSEGARVLGAKATTTAGETTLQDVREPVVAAFEAGVALYTNRIGAEAMGQFANAELKAVGTKLVQGAGREPQSDAEAILEGFGSYAALKLMRQDHLVRSEFPETDRAFEAWLADPKQGKRRAAEFAAAQDAMRRYQMATGAEMVARTQANFRSSYKRLTSTMRRFLQSMVRPDAKFVRDVVDRLREDAQRVSNAVDRRRFLGRLDDPDFNPELGQRAYQPHNVNAMMSVILGDLTSGDAGGMARPGAGAEEGTRSLRAVVAPLREDARLLARKLAPRVNIKGDNDLHAALLNRIVEAVMLERVIELYDKAVADGVDPKEFSVAESDPGTWTSTVDSVRGYLAAYDAIASKPRDPDDVESIIAHAVTKHKDTINEWMREQSRIVLESAGFSGDAIDHLLYHTNYYAAMAGFDPSRPNQPLWAGSNLVDRLVRNTGMMANPLEAMLTKLQHMFSSAYSMKRDKTFLEFAKLQERVASSLMSEGKPARAETRKMLGLFDVRAKGTVGVRIVEDASYTPEVMSRLAAKVEEALDAMPFMPKGNRHWVLAHPEVWHMYTDMAKTGKPEDDPRHGEITVWDADTRSFKRLAMDEDTFDFYRDADNAGLSNPVLLWSIGKLHAATKLVRLGAVGASLSFAIVDPFRNAAMSSIAANIGSGLKTSDGFAGWVTEQTLGTLTRFGVNLLRSYGSMAETAVYRALRGTRGDNAANKWRRMVKDSTEYVGSRAGKGMFAVLDGTATGKRIADWMRLTFGSHPGLVDAGGTFQSMGGAIAAYYGADAPGQERAVDRLVGARSATSRLAGAVEDLREVLSAAESVPKEGAFNERYNRHRADGDSHEVALRKAYMGGVDTMDYSYTAVGARLMNKLVPFYSAQIVGMDKLYRTMFQPFVRAATGGPASRVSKAEAAKAWARAVTLVTLPSLLEWLLNKDEEWWRELPEETRYTHWHFSGDNGKTMARFPKSHEVGMVFGVLPIAALDALYANADRISTRPKQFRRALSATVLRMIPGDWFDPRNMSTSNVPILADIDVMQGAVSLLPSAVKPVGEVWANRSSFTGKPIVPEYMAANLLPADQYRDYTTGAAKALGKLFDTSPLVIEHVLGGYTGSMSTRLFRTFDNAADALDWFMRDEPGEEFDLALTVARTPILSAIYREGPYYRETASEAALYDVAAIVKRIEGSFEEALERGDVERARALLPSLPANYEVYQDLLQLHRDVRKATADDRALAADMRRRLSPILARAVDEYVRNLK